MRFPLDESAEFRLAQFLSSQGHDVTAIARDYPNALSDQQVLAIAQRERRILITNDRDFGELVFRHGLPHSGVILLRMGSVDVEAKISRLKDVLTRYARDLDAFLVITTRSARVRN